MTQHCIKIPIKQITRKTVKDIKHNYIALYDLSYDPLANIYYIVISYIHDENLNLQLSVTQTITCDYIKEISHSIYFDSMIVSMIDSMIRRLKHDFYNNFNISIAIENDTFTDFINQLFNSIKSNF